MKNSRVWAYGLVPALVFGALGTAPAVGLDVPHSTLHHARPGSTHLSESHRRRSANAAPQASAGKSSTAHGVSAHQPGGTLVAGRHTTSAARTTVSVRRASLTTHHRYYERFTANSFATEIGR